MKKAILRNLFAFALLAAILLPAFYVSADLLSTVNEGGLNEIGSKGYNSSTPRDIRVVVIDVIKKLLGFVGIIMVAFIMYAGFQWMTAGGNATQVDGAKKRITNAVIGLILIFSAYQISNFIISCVIKTVEDRGGTFWGGICN